MTLRVSAIFFLLLGYNVSFAQNAPIDFEASGIGANWSWNVFENGPNRPIEIVSNPATGGINTSSTVAKFTTQVAGQPYAGVESKHGADIGKFTLSPSNAIIKIMVYKSVKSDVGIKLVVNNGGSTGEIKVANTEINKWEELTFDFTGKIGEPTSTDIDQIVIFPDFQSRSDSNVCYFDNITFSAAAPPKVPTTAAPTPTRDATNVVSLFSNAYTNKTVDTWRTAWSSASLEDLQIAGNDTKKYSSLDFVGVETVGANLIDASNMVYMHVDVWTANLTSFGVKLVDVGADANFGGGDDSEFQLNFKPALEEWVSYDIPLADFTGLKSMEHLAQYIFVGQPTGKGTVYMDNIYFHNEPLIDPNTPQVAAPTPTVPEMDVISLFSDAYTNKTVDTWRTAWSSATFSEVMIETNPTLKYSALDFVGVETVGPNLIDATNMAFIHIDAWTPNLTAFKVKLVDFGADKVSGGGDDVEHELTFPTPTLKSWNSYDIPLSDFTGLTKRSNLAQMIFVGNPTGTGTVFIDNVYFRKVSGSVNKLSNINVKVYPNPATTSLSIEANEPIKSVAIVNYLGQEVKSFTNLAGQTVLDIASLQAGVYFVKTTTDKGVSSARIIKN
jgi:hypothetical protein